MSESQKPDRERPKDTPRRKGAEEKLWHYAVSAFALLLVLTVAILTPNYLNYRYRVQHLEHLSGSSSTADNAASVTSVASNAPPAVTATSPKSDSRDLGEPPLKTSDIYETYGQLITMLLGFVAAVGVLCGYFAKKSVRELTEDVRDDMEREKTWFRRECDLALKEADAAEASAKASLDEATKLKTELGELVKKTHEGLKALDEAIAKYKDNGPTQASSTTKTTAAVDEQLEKELS
jgi:hypothetical protein